MTFRVTIVAVGLFIAPFAYGQNALDNNLQRGSGGVNTGVRQQQRPGAYQDALVTGNVGGLHRFRGNIDYRASGEFSERTSADDTFRFRLQSLPPTRHGVQQYQRPDVLPRRGPGANFLLRPGSGITAGEVTGQYERFGGGAVRRDDTAGLAARGLRAGGTAGDLRSQAALPLDQAAMRDRSIAIREDEEGSLYEVVASPLRGVRRREIGRALQLRNDEREATEPGATEKPEPVMEQQGRRVEDSLQPLSSLIGERLAPDRGGRSRDSLGEYRYSTGELEKAVLRPGDAFAMERGADVYYDLLRRVRGEDGKDQTYRPIAPDRLGQPPQTAVARAGAKQDERPGGGAATGAVQGRPDDEEKAAFERLVGRLKYDVTLKTFSSGTGTPFDKSMARAESLMAEGRYFEAEAAYGEAAGQPSATPLAAVGQAHAQIGSGLYVTAAQTLRRVFEHRPELIAARYAPPVLPAEERLREVDAGLDKALEESKSNDLLLLSAYVAYQRGDKEGVAESLAAIAAQDPEDTLVPLLQRVWSETRPEAPAEPDNPPADVLPEK